MTTQHQADRNLPRRPTAGTSRSFELDTPSRRPPLWLLTIGALALGVAVAASLWFFALKSNKSTPATTGASIIKPIALSASGLSTLGRAVGQPIYWAGPQ